MRIKLDENLPRSLTRLLNALGYDTLTVYDQSLQGCDDAAIWNAVVQEQRFLITQDVEFADLRKYPLGSHSGVMLLRLQFPNCEQIERVIHEIFQREPVAQWHGSLVIVSERKLRVIRPEKPNHPENS